MNERSMPDLPTRDRPLVLYDLLEQIAGLEAEDGDPVEVEQLVAEYRRLRAEL